MRYFTKTIGSQDYDFRLTSADIVELEKKFGQNILDVVKTISFDTLATLLRYMRKVNGKNLSYNETIAFVDEAIDEGYDITKFYTEIIFPVCEVSGIISKEDLNTIMEAITK